MTSSAPPVVVASGHLVDAPDRPAPRFPPDQVPRVTREIEVAFAAWGVGSGTTLVCGGARGADIIAAEVARARGARVRVLLALPPQEFQARSVDLPGSDWAARFGALLAEADVEVLDRSGGGTDDSVFARTNAWMVETARRLAGQATPNAVVVWNGKDGDGPGGTADMVVRLGHQGPDPDVVVIDPTPRRYEARQDAPGPKKILTLDGGGIRGVLTLEILAAIEEQLKAHYGERLLVLADYFDYIAGTSTGAIIASGLALGMRVGDLQDAFGQLGHHVFRKRPWLKRLRSLYRDTGLTEQLNGIFGADRTLGDPELRCLLMVVLHRTDTDSAWPLSNCTRARYNRADRYLADTSDRNLDLSLVRVMRGSTAAPLYFPPETIRVGARDVVFQDGGVTAFNNPALITFLMATLPAYRLNWGVGEDQLLVVSAGTGFAAASHSGLTARDVGFRFNATNLPRVFMNGASVSQDLVCRVLGCCRRGPCIDREFGARIGSLGLGDRNLFSYLRYDADLSDEGLIAQGITSPEEQKDIRKLDSVNLVGQLARLGAKVAGQIDIEKDFEGFLGPLPGPPLGPYVVPRQPA